MTRRGILLIACTLLPSTALLSQTRPPGPPPGTLIDVGGYRLHILCSGSSSAGAPTVILDAGAGAFSTVWSAVQRAIPQIRSCAYDRAGWGWSDPGPGPRTISQDAAELGSLLREAHVSGPYVLVGHSYGGLIVRRYAALHPSDVVGMVLVDPAHEDARLFYVKKNTWLRVRDQSQGRIVPPPRTLAPGDSTMSYYDPERDYWSEEFQEFHDARIANPRMFGSLPLVILAADANAPPPGMSQEMWAEYRAERLAQLKGLTALSSHARFVRDPTSGHDIPTDDPRLVAACIAEVVSAVTGVRTIDLATRCKAPGASR